MMASKFHKNAIITGYIDFYCLVCESYIRSEEDADKHIEKLIHKKNLSCAIYYEKFKDDHIWKVKKGYFCEFCNKYLKTATKVGSHVAESKHNDIKGAQLLKRVGNSIVSNNTLIKDDAWNGIIGETCVICNTEFYNENIHKTEQGHVLNLILKNVEFITESDIYRKVDESSFQCLTCNQIFLLESLHIHFKDEIHIKNFKACSQCTSPTVEKKKEEELINLTTLDKKVTQGANSNREPIYKSEIKCDDKVKLLKNENMVAKNVDRNKPNNVENHKSFKTKNNATGNSNKASNKCDKETLCKHDDSNHETEFDPLLKDSVISADVKEMKKMWKKDDKPDETKPEAQSNIKEQEKAKILDLVTKSQKKGVNVKFENDSVFCNICLKNLDFSFKAIQTHIKEHNCNRTEKVKSELIIEASHSKTDIPSKDLDKNHNIATQANKNDKQENGNNLDKALVSYTPVDATKTENQTDEAKAVKPGTSKTEAATVTEDPEDPVSYSKANHMTYNKTNSNAYCRICNIRVPANLKNMKEHINGNLHRKKIAQIAPENKIISMKKFITKLSSVTDICNDDVIVNDKYCVTRHSFLMITQHGQRLRCQACEVNLTNEDVNRHLESCSHERAMAMTPVVWNLPNEFVREVRPGLFHCGFCHLIVGQWDNVASHLMCTDHLENREYAAKRLAENLPGILEYRRFKARQLLLMSMGIGLRGFNF